MPTGKLSVRELCVMGIFTSLLAVLSQISFMLPYGVPVTLQTFAVALAGVVLGAKRGALSVAFYVLLGAVGVPVFAGFTGGLGIVLGPTGGFLLSFPLLALLAGLGAGKGGFRLALGLVAGAALNFLCGMAVYSALTSSGWGRAFLVCVLPFLPFDIVKMLLAGVLGTKVRQALAKSRLAIS